MGSDYSQIFIFFIPLLPEFCFPLTFEILPKSGSYRLPTHRHDAHRKFFDDPFFFKNGILDCFGNYVYLFIYIFLSQSTYFLILISEMQSVFGGRI